MQIINNVTFLAVILAGVRWCANANAAPSIIC